MTDQEIEFLETHESNPSKANTDVPPAQVEWQWEDGDLVYNCHLFKELYDNDHDTTLPEDTSVEKRYKLVGFAYNKTNNLSGVVEDYTFVSNEFSDEADIEILENFIGDKDFLYDNDTEERKVYSFSRPTLEY